MKKTLVATTAMVIVVSLTTPAAASEPEPGKPVERPDAKNLLGVSRSTMAYAISDQATSQELADLQDAARDRAAEKAATSRAKSREITPESTAPTSVPEVPEGTPGWVTAVNWAQTKLGTPYLWGGTGTEQQGGRFDCSGLTQAAYRKAGIEIPRIANDQYRASGNHPGRSSLRTGDLVFYGSSERGIHHVGIYVGGGQMIHAPNSGSVIRFDRIDYMSDYYGATRVS